MRTRPEQILIYEFVPNGDLEKSAPRLTLKPHLEAGAGYPHRCCTWLGIPPQFWPCAPRHQARQHPSRGQHAGQDCRLRTSEGGGGQHSGHDSSDGNTGLCGSHLLSHIKGDQRHRRLWDLSMDAPDDAVLRLAKLALSCTKERSADRPSMASIANELLAIRNEVMGIEELGAAIKVDMQAQKMEFAISSEKGMDAWPPAWKFLSKAASRWRKFLGGRSY
ncbi:unnamed protein product [Closterium sp. Yama58-4]|nr:unnamed protein product [Closterium sp. Yama58-4]